MKPLELIVPVVLAVSLSGCAEKDGLESALALAKIGLPDAVQAAKDAAGGGFALEAELSGETGGAVYHVEVLKDDGVSEVVVDGVSGEAAAPSPVTLDAEEQQVIDAIRALAKEERLSLPKAVKRGQETLGGGVPVEVDVELEAEGPVFVIVYSTDQGRRETVVPIQKASTPNEPADEG